MLPDLATSLSTTLAVASLLFFVAVYIVVAVRVFRADPDELAAHARMALEPPLSSLPGSRADRGAAPPGAGPSRG